MNDRQLRFLLAQDVALVLQAERGEKVFVTDIPCPQCRMPLLDFEKQNLPHCWYCAADNRSAQTAKSKLLLAKIKAAKNSPDDPPVSPFTFGMPL
jgi:hypothetical protein